MRQLRRVYHATLLTAAATLAACGGPTPTFTSEYTTIDRDKCALTSEDASMGTATWRCQSFRDLEVHMSEGDLRAYLSFGDPDEDSWLSSQTLAPYNKLGTTLEWRLVSFGEEWTPVATIVRYYTRVPGGEDEFIDGEVLVVSKLEDANACHMAYIDVLSNENAVDLARNAADAHALDFNCATDSVISVGAPGPSLPDADLRD